MSEPIQSIATNNYLLATPIGSGYMEASALEYDGDKISGYSGSAFKAGDEFPQSATDAIGYVTATSANIDSTIDNVSSNSGAWGGSALPISAGPGIKLEMNNGVLVASTDETVLYSGDLSQGNKDTITLSEPITNFEKFKVYGAWNYNNDCRMYSQVEIDTVNSGLRFDLSTFGPVSTTAQQSDAYCYFTVGSYKLNTSTAINVINAVRFHTNLGAFSDSDTIKIYKVIGINRKEA